MWKWIKTCRCILSVSSLGFEELEYVLAPKLKAFQLALSQLQGHAEAVYDVTIAYGNTTDHTKGERIPAPGMPEYLMEKSPHIHVHLERIPLSEIPQEQVQLQNWMFKRFQLKDRWLLYTCTLYCLFSKRCK